MKKLKKTKAKLKKNERIIGAGVPQSELNEKRQKRIANALKKVKK